MPTSTTSRIMITLSVSNFNYLSQRTYDDIISQLQLHMLECPSCGHSACLTRHGYYYRSVRTYDGIISLRILRVKCSCGATHSILLSSLVPYSRTMLKDHVYIISNGYTADTVAAVQLSTPEISFWSIRNIFRTFHAYWKERLASFHIGISDLGSLVAGCFTAFSRQFMQNRVLKNLLFQVPT